MMISCTTYVHIVIKYGRSIMRSIIINKYIDHNLKPVFTYMVVGMEHQQSGWGLSENWLESLEP